MRLCPKCDQPSLAAICGNCGHIVETSDGFELYAPQEAQRGNGYDPAIYSELASLEDHNFWFCARNRLIVHRARRHFPSARSILEIGCGTGQVLRALAAAFPDACLHGSELFVEGLPFARVRAPDARLMQMDATHIPFEDEFDLIGAFDVIEHIHEDELVLSRVHRALKRGGGVIVTVPQHPRLWSHQDELACHVRRYRRGELEEKLRRAGFRVIYSTSFVTVLLPLLVLSRRAMSRKDSDPLHEMRIGRAANALLAAALAAEFGLLCSGARLPIGGSRLVLAVKDS